MRITVKNILALVSTAAMAWGLLHLCLTPDEDRELRLPASTLLRAIDSADYGAAIENSGDDAHVWAIRSSASNRLLGEELVWTAQYVLNLPTLMGARESAEAVQDKGLSAQAEKSPHLAALLEQDGWDGAGLLSFLTPGHNDALDYQGRPVRWQMAENLIQGYTRLRPGHYLRESPARTQPQPAPVIPQGNRITYYRSLVENFARRYNLNSSLVMAIIHSESDFSPALVSNKSAMGLMQLLPSTASDEVHRFLYGRRGQIGFEDLRNPEINIRYGTAYLHILLNRYFPNVHNRDVREVCAIAAYNMGPNRFLRLYGSTNEQAVDKINNMSEDEFYDDLIRRLPARETRAYVQKVRRMKKHYSSLP